MTRTIHRTYDSWKTASPDDERDLIQEADDRMAAEDDVAGRDPDAEYDAWRDEQMQKRCRGLQDAVEVMREVEAYLDNRADVDDGIPNQAMRMLVGVRDVIRKLEGR